MTARLRIVVPCASIHANGAIRGLHYSRIEGGDHRRFDDRNCRG